MLIEDLNRKKTESRFKELTDDLNRKKTVISRVKGLTVDFNMKKTVLSRFRVRVRVRVHQL